MQPGVGAAIRKVDYGGLLKDGAAGLGGAAKKGAGKAKGLFGRGK